MVRLEELKSGLALTVCALVVNGRSETAEYFNSLSPGGRKRLGYVLGRLAERGLAGFRDETLKRLDSLVYEIKEHRSNTRLFCFRSEARLVVCTHGARKPAGRARYQAEMAKVHRLYEQCLVEGALHD
jgi:hypothetical protein